MRIRKAGFSIRYAPDAVVFHELRPERYGRTYHRRLMYKRGIVGVFIDRIPFVSKYFPLYLPVPGFATGFTGSGTLKRPTKAREEFGEWWGYLNGKLGSSRLI